MEILTLKRNAFGLDISDLSLKIAKLERTKSGFVLASYGEYDIPSGIIERGEVKDEKKLSEVIKKALEKVKGKRIKTKYVVISLPEEKAFLNVIQMPIMEEEELKSAILYEIENYIPLSAEEVCWDFEIVKPIYGKPDHLDVLLAAIPREIVIPYINALKKANLIPFGLEVEAQATSRALIKNQMSPYPILIIDLGATRTGFIIFSGYALRFTSSIPVCGKTLSETLMKAFKISSQKAEDLKKRYGLTDKKIFKALKPQLNELIAQIKKYLDFYHNHAKHEHLKPGVGRVKKILLCGGGANLKGIKGYFYSQLKIPVEEANPWVNIFSEPVRILPPISFHQSLGYTMALGLALKPFVEEL